MMPVDLPCPRRVARWVTEARDEVGPFAELVVAAREFRRRRFTVGGR